MFTESNDYDARRDDGYVTKWFIMNERLRSLQYQVNELESQLDAMHNTPCGLGCSYCGTVLETEEDFAKHFTIKDQRYLNLGECPHDPSRH